ncbi:hypothetical protein H7Y40_02750 [Pedobacter sp.]|nr:hypothetical protein [Candidatus Saccharibacteria bacterium]
MKSSHPLTPMLVGALAVAVITGVGGYLFVPYGTTSNLATTASSEVATVVASSATTTNAASTATNYKDGTYTATTSYRVPHGSVNSIKVTLTVKAGVITAAKTVNDTSDRESAGYVDSFESNIESAIVGSSLNGASASRVGGASLTSVAFDDALQTIVNDAKA